MSVPTTQNQQFSFQVGELPSQLAIHLGSGETGYWCCQFDRLAHHQPAFHWYLGVVNDRVFCSGTGYWSASALLRLLWRYSSQMRKVELQPALRKIQHLVDQDALNPQVLAHRLEQQGILTEQQIAQAMLAKILSDFEQYSVISNGQVNFIEDQELANQSYFSGFDVGLIVEKFQSRQAQWNKIKFYVPSLDLIPMFSADAANNQDLSPEQRAKIVSLTQTGSNIRQIAQQLAKDNIEVSLLVAKFVQAGILTLHNPISNLPTVMVIDDSVLMLTQFRHWLKPSGYKVVTCQDAAEAIPMIHSQQPAVIFIDINMPVISGFELVKQIRSISAIATIPIAILTGEQKLSNKWRAQWSGCEFLTKPMTASEQQQFAITLQDLIPRLVKSSSFTSTQP